MKAFIKPILFLSIATQFSCGRAQFAMVENPQQDSRKSLSAKTDDSAGARAQKPAAQASSSVGKIASSSQNVPGSNPALNPIDPSQPGNPSQPNSPIPQNPSGSGGGSPLPANASPCGVIANGTPSDVLTALTWIRISNPPTGTGATHLFILQDGVLSNYPLSQFDSEASFDSWKSILEQSFLANKPSSAAAYFGRIDMIKLTCAIAT